MQARRVTAQLIYNGRDISTDVAPLLVALTYTDNAGERADTLDVTFGDLNRLWGGRWRPRAGDTLDCTLVASDPWTSPGVPKSLPCGRFEILGDGFSLATRQATIRATSVPITAGIRRERRHRDWENLTLREIAGDIARHAGLTLAYHSQVNPRSERRDQRYQSDVAFLQGFASQFGLRVKIRPPKLVVFDEATYEQRAPVLVITPASPLTEAEIRRNYDDVYAGCKVVWHDPGKGHDAHSATFMAPAPPPVTDLLIVTERVESSGAAQLVAKARLREKNRNAVTLTLGLPFTPSLTGAGVVELRGFSDLDDGRYYVERVRHGILDTTSAELHRCLTGY